MEPWIIKEGDSSAKLNSLEPDIFLTKRFPLPRWELGDVSVDRRTRYLRRSRILDLKLRLILTSIILTPVEITIMNSSCRTSSEKYNESMGQAT